MTRFVAEAIAHRGSGGGGGGDRARQQALEAFLTTGVHPGQQAAAAAAAESALPLPAPDASRPHVFLDLALNSRPLGRAVVEVFEDTVPLAAAQLLRRCSRGSVEPLAGAAAARLLRAHDVMFPSSTARGAGTTLDTNAAARRTRFSAAGVVGVSRDGSGGVAVSLGRAPGLDETHMVVGRVVLFQPPGEAPPSASSAAGPAFASALNAVPTDPATDAPRGRLVVLRAGRSDAGGCAAAEGEEEGGNSSAAAAADPRATAKEVRATVDEALRQGLGRAGAGGGAVGGGEGGSKASSRGATGAATGAAAVAKAAGAPAAKRRRTMMDALSGSEGEDEEEEEEEEEDDASG